MKKITLFIVAFMLTSSACFAATSTTNYALTKPAVNDPTDADLWGTELNSNMDTIDAQLKVATDTIHRSVTGTDSITTSDRNKIILADATSGAFAETLPAAATASDGFTVTIKKVDSSANAVTVTGSGSENINGSNTFALSAQYDSITIVSNGSAWLIMSNTKAASLGTMASQNANNVAITGGTISGVSGFPSVNNGASGYIVIGAVTIEWGTGTCNSTTSFPISFNSTPYSVQAISSQAGVAIVSTPSANWTASGFKCSGGSNNAFSYTAIGPS